MHNRPDRFQAGLPSASGFKYQEPGNAINGYFADGPFRHVNCSSGSVEFSGDAFKTRKSAMNLLFKATRQPDLPFIHLKNRK